MTEPKPIYTTDRTRATIPLQLAATGDHRQYRGRLVSAGRIRNALDQPGRIVIPAQAISLAVAAGRFEDLACFIDHPPASFFTHQSPSLRNLLGTWQDVRWNADTQSADGILRVYENGETLAIVERLDEILADAKDGEEIPDIGVSIIFYPRFKKREEGESFLTVEEFRKVESADLVFSPAADGRILEALSTLHGGYPMAEDTLSQSSGSSPSANSLASDSSPPTMPEPIAPPVTHSPPRQEIPQEWLESLAEAAALAVESRVAPLVESQVVDLGDRPASRITSVRAASLEVEAAVDWLFGVPNSKTPPPELRNSAKIYTLLTGDVHWRGLFDGAQALATANVTTLADLAVNAMNKVVIDQWDALIPYRWYEMISVVQPNDGSLQNMQWISFGGIGDLPVVAEGAAYTEATVVDAREIDSFTKYGYYVGITRKMLRNSEIGRLQAIPRALAIAALRTRESKIASLFTDSSGAGPTLDDDSTALFHANHSNLATTAFSYAAWAAARTECYKQTEAGSSKRLGFWPRFWLGPADLYDTALEIFGYGAGPGGKPGTADNDVNPYAENRAGDPRPIPLAVPSFTDTNDWAYLVDPAVQPIIQMSYAQNPGGRTHPLPELFSVVSETAGLMFTNDTMPVKVRDEFAYGVSGYRGIGKRNVA